MPCSCDALVLQICYVRDGISVWPDECIIVYKVLQFLAAHVSVFLTTHRYILNRLSHHPTYCLSSILFALSRGIDTYFPSPLVSWRLKNGSNRHYTLSNHIRAQLLWHQSHRDQDSTIIKNQCKFQPQHQGANYFQIRLHSKFQPSRPEYESLDVWTQFVGTDYMVNCQWTSTSGRVAPRLQPQGPLQLLPSASVLHYATEWFEGLNFQRA